MLRAGCVCECPGCRHRELPVHESLAQKSKWLAAKLSPYTGAILPFQSLDDEDRWGYRKKVTLSVVYRENRWLFGMKSRDEIIPIPGCPVHHPIVYGTVRLLMEILPEERFFPLSFYVQYGRQVVLILKSKGGASLEWLTGECKKALEQTGIEGLWIHYNPSAGRRIFEKTPLHLLYGKETSRDGNGMLYGIGAFQQVIPSLYLQSLDEAEKFFDAGRDDRIVDLYSGIGYSAARWVKTSQCVAVELGGSAFNLLAMNVPGAEIYRGKCAERLPQVDKWLEQKKFQGRVMVYANPPRTGLEPEVTEWLVNRVLADKIAYLSCSAGTLGRDLDKLVNAGYHAEKIIPYDFFPQTHHFEVLALLSR
ncbi:MAG: class I SAM-dependent RNA methyltransferase [Bacteroidales bacterium]|nr:class I SAM-dependent RNA methyltransferase [Bacteroidales bacterium]